LIKNPAGIRAGGVLKCLLLALPLARQSKQENFFAHWFHHRCDLSASFYCGRQKSVK
jgi:hypothetical protein